MPKIVDIYKRRKKKKKKITDYWGNFHFFFQISEAFIKI